MIYQPVLKNRYLLRINQKQTNLPTYTRQRAKKKNRMRGTFHGLPKFVELQLIT